MSGSSGWSAWLEAEIAGVRARGQWRETTAFDARGPSGLRGGRAMVSFASNDYLGLTVHPVVVEAAHAALDRWGAGTGAARLIVGHRPVHQELEDALAEWRGAESALVFPTGFAANLGVLTTLADRDTLVVSDELNHASIIDGCRASGAQVAVARHADLEHFEELLDRAKGRRSLVVTDAVFSMDGDVAPVDELAALCARRDALLVVDEAHSVLGPELPETAARVVRVGTLSKTLGALGGFVAADATVIDLLRNRARQFIFTTATTPADAAAALAAVRLLGGDEGRALIRRLRELVDRVAPGHPSPIIPVVLGDEAVAVAAAAALAERGLLVPAIRPPTVPAGSSRLRITLSAGHTDGQLDALLAALHELGLGASLPADDAVHPATAVDR